MAKKKKKAKHKGVTQPQAKPENLTNQPVKDALKAIQDGGGAQAQQALSMALRSAKLISPCEFNESEIKSGKGGIRFYLINTNEGKAFFPTFTDLQTAQNFSVSGEDAAEIKYLVRTMKDYDKLISDPNGSAEGIVINPGTDNLVVPYNLVAIAAGKSVANQQIQVKKRSAGEASYVEPAVYPTRLANAVYDYCLEHPEISRVWLKGKVDLDGMTYFLAVEADNNDKNILSEIEGVALPEAKDVPVEAAFTTPQIMEKAIGDAVALYDRELEL